MKNNVGNCFRRAFGFHAPALFLQLTQSRISATYFNESWAPIKILLVPIWSAPLPHEDDNQTEDRMPRELGPKDQNRIQSAVTVGMEDCASEKHQAMDELIK